MKLIFSLLVSITISLFSVAYADTAASGSASSETDSPSTLVSSNAVPVAAPQALLPAPKTGELINWWNGGNQLLVSGQRLSIVDVATGKKFNAVRSYGHNHADMETLTEGDSFIMKEVFGGGWSWERRSVIVLINGREIAGSISGMPHAGLDNAAEGKIVSGRSAGFGRGVNLDRIKGNGMNGVFDLHLLGSRTHSTNKMDAKHQAAVQAASGGH